MGLKAEFAVRSAIRSAVLNDAVLSAALNASFYDGAPREATFPFVSFGDVVLRDWSTGSDRGLEHQIWLEIWSTQPGNGETLQLADLVVACLAAAPLQPVGCQLIDLRFVSFEARRESNGRFAKGRLRFRAITEMNVGVTNVSPAR
jgi:hypothetical protein